MGRDDSVYVQDILDAITTVEGYLVGVDEPAFRRQQRIQDAVIHRLIIIGEAVKHLSITMRSQDASIPWRNIAGVRDMLLYQYFGVDLDQVWVTATEDFQRIRMSLQPESI